MIYDELRPLEYNAGMVKTKLRHSIMSIFEEYVQVEPYLLGFKGKIHFL
jgi:hypothetical protein